MEGLVVPAYALYALALGVLAGLVFRRTVAAMTSTLVAFAATRFLVLEFVRGHDLETVLNQSPHLLAEATVVEWALQILDVLHYLHNHKPTAIVFRDLKPSNVMLTDADRVAVADDVESALQGRDIEELNTRAGHRPGRGYVHPAEAADEILDEAGVAIPDEQEDNETEVEKFREFLDTISPEDFGRAT